MSSKKETPLITPPRVAPEHGHGRLFRGGVPGNRGGTGRPPSAIRGARRTVLGERLGALVRIADDPNATASDRIRAFEVLARYGLGTHDATEHSVALLSAAKRDARLRLYLAELHASEGHADG